MKNISTVLHVVSLALISVLFFLLFKNNNSHTAISSSKGTDSTMHVAAGSIAYFEMDTIERHYNYVKDAREQLKSKEQTITNELNNTKKTYMKRVQDLQNKSATMSQELQDQQFKLMQDIFKKIEDYLKIYNQDKKYSYIFSHSAGDMIYFKDETNDITPDLLKGLNDAYKK